MTGDLRLLEQPLAAAPFSGLTVYSQRFPRLNHFNVLPAGLCGRTRRVLAGGEKLNRR
jgi:hypothetical protein